MKSFVLVFLTALLVMTPKSSRESGSARPILEEMLKAVKQVRTLRYELEATERVKDRVLSAGSAIKINMHPRKIYFKSIRKGIEVLYVDHHNKNHALVNPNRFPYMNLSLDPYKSIMRQNQHHTIFELGFAQIGQITEMAMRKHSNDFDRHFFYVGTVTHEGKICDKIYAEFSNFRYINYTAKKGETARSIGQKFAVGEFRIYLKNEDLSFNEVIPEGKVIRIPSDYGSKILLHIDRETKLPLYLSAFDDQGFYESYSFSKLKVNSPIPEEEFRRDFPDYRF
jgi:outer membrane lipoprotein-sorting protein